jgi:integrase
MAKSEYEKAIEREAKRLAGVTAPGMHRVEGIPGLRGINLQIGGPEARSWVLRYMLHGKARYLGLGSAFLFSLAEAAGKAQDARKLLAVGIDPLEDKRAQATRQRLEAVKQITFKQAAEECINQKAPGWKSPKHAEQWRSTLATYAYPRIGDLPVQAVDVAAVLDVIRPIWLEKTETASRVRGRIQMVLEYATPQYRTGDNPADWDILKHKLADRDKIAKVEPHPALAYKDVPAFMAALRQRESISARCLEFVVLTACRTSEALLATWSEIDFDAATWTVPGSRMKAGRLHVVPLSARALEIVRELQAIRQSQFIFPGLRGPMSNMSLLKMLKMMARPDLTVHGFRSAFRDWAGDETSADRETIEFCLAHGIGDKVEASYRRGDALAKRRQLMDQWGSYCTGAPGADVIQIDQRRA